MRFPNRQQVERVRKQYPAGTRVELVQMDDAQALQRRIESRNGKDRLAHRGLGRAAGRSTGAKGKACRRCAGPEGRRCHAFLQKAPASGDGWSGCLAGGCPGTGPAAPCQPAKEASGIPAERQEAKQDEGAEEGCLGLEQPGRHVGAGKAAEKPALDGVHLRGRKYEDAEGCSGRPGKPACAEDMDAEIDRRGKDGAEEDEEHAVASCRLRGQSGLRCAGAGRWGKPSSRRICRSATIFTAPPGRACGRTRSARIPTSPS